MSALTQQLEQLKTQQEELEKRIQDEAETKKKLNNEASIERLEALVQPITETLDFVDPNNHNYNQAGKSQRIALEERLKHDILAYNCAINDATTRKHRPYPRPIRRKGDLENEEIFVTIIGILKKQDERIKELEATEAHSNRLRSMYIRTKLHKPQEHHQ